MVTLAQFSKQSDEDGYRPTDELPSGDVDTVSQLSAVPDVPKSEFAPSALQQFSGRLATNATFGLESTMAKGVVFLGNMNVPYREHERERAAYHRRVEAEAGGDFAGEITATSDNKNYTIGNAVRNAGWNWYFKSQERMRDLGADWTTGEGAEAHPVATMMADASTSLLACMGGFAVAGSAAKGVIMAAQGAKLIPAINAARTAAIATGVGKAVSIGGISGTVLSETYSEALGKGYNEKVALALGLTDATLEGVLEMWGLDNFLKKGASKVLYVARNALVQGSEEFLQGVKSGVLRTWSGLRKYEGVETYVDILTESLLAGVVGAVTGGAAGTGLAMSSHGDMVRSFVDIGMKKKEAVILANEAWKQAMGEATGVLDEDIDPDTMLEVEEKFKNSDRKVARAEKATRLGEQEPTPERTGIPTTEPIPGAELARTGRIEQLGTEMADLETQKQELLDELGARSEKGEKVVGVERKIDKIEDQIFDKDVESLGLELSPNYITDISGRVKVSLKAGVVEKARVAALRKQIRKYNEGVSAGRNVTKNDIKTFQRRVLRTINESEVLTDKQKLRMAKTIPSIQENTRLDTRLKYLEMRIKDMESANLKNTYTKAIKNIFKKASKKKMGAESTEVLRKLMQLNKKTDLNPTDYLGEDIGEGVPFETTLAYDLAIVKSGEATVVELKTAYDDFSNFLENGVNKSRAEQKKIKQDRKENIDQVRKDMTGEGIVRDPNAPEKKGGPKILGIFKYTFDTIIRRMANKSGKPLGESAMERMFSTAKHDETKRGIMFMFSRKNLSDYGDAFGLENDATVLGSMESDETNMSTFTWETGEGDTKQTHSVELSKSQIRKRVMEWQRTQGKRALSKHDMYTDTLMADMIDTLGPQDFAYMEKQFETYTELYNLANGLYKKIKGVNLPFDDFYTHLFSEGGTEMQDSVVDTMLNDSGRPAFMSKATEISEFKRAKGGAALKPVSDTFAVDKYINDIAQFVGFGNLVNNMQTVLMSKDIQTVMKEKYGESMIDFVKKHIDKFKSGKLTKEVDSFQWLDNFRLRMVRGVLAVNPKIGVKQLVSTFAYLNAMPAVDLMKGLADLPRAIDSGDIYKLTESMFMQTRGDTYQRDLVLIKQMADQAREGQWRMAKDSKLDHVLLSLMRTGDRAAIYMGGWAMFKYETEVKGVDEVTALRNFQEFTNKTQQSGDLSQMPSEISSTNPFTRLLTSFKQSQYQYFNNYMDTIWNAKRMSPGLVAKKLFVYHALMPSIWQFVANAFRWDSRDQVRAFILGPTGELVIVGDALKHLVNWGWSKVYSEKKYNWYESKNLLESYFKDVQQTIDGVYDLASTGKMKADEGLDLIKNLAGALTPVLGAKAGVPKQAVKIVKGAQSIGKGEYLDGLYQFMGYSEYDIAADDRAKKKKSKSGSVSFNN